MDKECFQNQFRGIFEDLHLVQALQCGILQLLYQEMTVKIYIRNEDCFLSCRENNQILKMQVLWVLSRFEALRLTSSNSEPSRPPMAVWDEKGDRCHLSVGSELSRNTWDYYNTVTSSQSFLDQWLTAVMVFTLSTASYNTVMLQNLGEKMWAAHTLALHPPGGDTSIF